jgi:hypothetical protein
MKKVYKNTFVQLQTKNKVLNIFYSSFANLVNFIFVHCRQKTCFWCPKCVLLRDFLVTVSKTVPVAKVVFRNFGLVNYDPELLTELGRKFRVSSAPEFEIQ